MLSCSFVVVHASILGNIILLRGRLERVCAIIKGRGPRDGEWKEPRMYSYVHIY